MAGAVYDLILRGGAVFTPSGLMHLDVAVSAGKIVSFQPRATDSADASLDITGLTVLPGVIDTQVHFREPGLTHKEDLLTGSRAAVLGGVTSVFEMPNTFPPTTDRTTFAEKLAAARNRMYCNYAFFIGATPDNAELLGPLERLPGCAGVKVFMGSSTGSLLIKEDRQLLKVLQNTRRRIAFHAEDEAILQQTAARKAVDDAVNGNQHGTHVRQHPLFRSEKACFMATERLVKLARLTGRNLHVLHVSTAQEMALLAAHKDLISVEVTPQHLTLHAPHCYEQLGNLAQMNPPIREQRHQRALWYALAAGVVDLIGSDHAPHTKEEKDRPYPNAPSGMPGVQTLLPLMLDHVHHGRLTLARLVDLTSAGPQRLYAIQKKGRVVVGYDADLTVVDLNLRQTVSQRSLASKCGWSPFTGIELVGWPIHTIVNGQLTVRDQEIVADLPHGGVVSFDC